jgi:hypothetical protein
VSAERWYRLLLRAYPAGHRDELLGTLLETGADRRTSSARESAALVRGAFSARARRRADLPVRWWADGLHLAALALAVAAFGAVTPELPDWPLRPAVFALLVVTVLYGRFRVAAPIAVFAAVQNGVGVFPWMRVQSTDVRFGASLWLLAGVLLVLAVRRRACPRSRWWFVVPAAMLVDSLFLTVGPGELTAFLELGLMATGLCATVAARDLRWLLASAVHLLPAVLGYLHDPHRPVSPQDVVYHAALAGLLLATAVAARHARRRV